MKGTGGRHLPALWSPPHCLPGLLSADSSRSSEHAAKTDLEVKLIINYSVTWDTHPTLLVYFLLFLNDISGVTF